MALNIQLLADGRQTGGGFTAVIGTIDFDSSYPTGGEAIAATDLGLNTLDMLIVGQRFGYSIEWDKANAKLLVYQTPIIVSAATTASFAGVVPAALVEASDTKDLLAVSLVDFICWGR